ncbi:MOSC N-terminal beta barrel domain-containing protein [Lacimicrobium sp. SS2-24]|uniref:MOSC domain-containing protein n=1 Tax=Lacimicrobium sp. SS2-24 TaxID=2005569 RepID=UPI000B4B5B4C|nr:MOSC N-terminal beta barrel domain-containing protein [Lacimicrobium sp. SS2-24]
MTATLSALTLYPIKSTRGLQVSRAVATAEGLAFDRRFMLADEKGRMLTGRALPKLVQVQATPTPLGLLVTHAQMPPLQLDFAAFTGARCQTHVWKDHFSAFATHSDANHWFSTLLDRPCQLLYAGTESPRFSESANTTVSFADGFPLLLLSEASLADLNARCQQRHSMAQFRPNLVVTNTAAFAEDSWSRIRVGEVELQLDCPCSRCIFVTRDADSGDFLPQREPLNTLAQFRKDQHGKINFGMNVTVIKGGVLELGGEIEVLEHRVAETY